MNDERHPAEERLLDAALVHVVARPTVVGVTRPSRPRPLLTAALLLFGVGVVGTTMWSLRHGERATASAQDPEPAPAPLPPEVLAENGGALAALPEDTANLVLRTFGPADLAGLSRFRGLRRLSLVSTPGVAGVMPGWRPWSESSGDADALRPLGDLALLEDLQLPWDLVVQPALLQPLERSRHLRTIGLYSTICSPLLADAIAVMPALRELRLSMCAVDAAFLARLAAAPRPLVSLELQGCPGLDDEAWQALGTLRTLQRLVVSSQNSEGTTAVAGKTLALRTLGEAAFAAFAALPELRELRLDESAFDDRMLLRLPGRLQVLDLGDRPMGALAADTLRRLGGLRELTFGCGLEPAPAIATLAELRLERLDYRGALTPELLRACAAQPGLRNLSLKLRRRVDLAPLAASGSLAELRLIASVGIGEVGYQPKVEDLLPLRQCEGLQRLDLVNCGFSTAEVGELLERRVTVVAHEYL